MNTHLEQMIVLILYEHKSSCICDSVYKHRHELIVHNKMKCFIQIIPTYLFLTEGKKGHNEHSEKLDPGLKGNSQFMLNIKAE